MSAENLYDYQTDKVRELTPDQLTKKGDLSMVKDGEISAKIYFIIFYAPWCGHCKNMKEDVSNLARGLSENGLDDVFCAVNCEKHKELLSKKDIDIQGYPTINFVMDGKVESYEGPRNPEGLLTKITTSIEDKLGVDATAESDSSKEV